MSKLQESRRAAFKTWHDAQVARLLEHNEPTAARVWRDFEGMHWNAWSAALDSVVVELPETVNPASCAWDLGYDAGLDVGKGCIEAAGIRVEIKS